MCQQFTSASTQGEWNALKYILRAGHKKDASLTDTEKQIEDLNKAIWYLKDEIKRITEFGDKTKA